MDDLLLARLDDLQRGARQPRPQLQGYDAHDNNSGHGAYEVESDYYAGDETYSNENAYPRGMDGTELAIS
jgi:hypothetical protein